MTVIAFPAQGKLTNEDRAILRATTARLAGNCRLEIDVNDDDGTDCGHVIPAAWGCGAGAAFSVWRERGRLGVTDLRGTFGHHGQGAVNHGPYATMSQVAALLEHAMGVRPDALRAS